MGRLKPIYMLLAICVGFLLGFSEQRHYTSSGEQSADALIASYDNGGYLYGMVITTDGTNAVTLKMYDATEASGEMLLPTLEIPTSATNRGEVWSWEPPLAVSTGIYVDVTCAGTVKYVIYHRRQ